MDNCSSERKESSFVPPFPFSQSILKGIIRVEERDSQRKAVSIRESAADSSREIRMEEKKYRSPRGILLINNALPEERRN